MGAGWETFKKLPSVKPDAAKNICHGIAILVFIIGSFSLSIYQPEMKNRAIKIALCCFSAIYIERFLLQKWQEVAENKLEN